MNYTVTEQTKKYPVMFEASYTGKAIRWDELTEKWLLVLHPDWTLKEIQVWHVTSEAVSHHQNLRDLSCHDCLGTQHCFPLTMQYWHAKYTLQKAGMSASRKER